MFVSEGGAHPGISGLAASYVVGAVGIVRLLIFAPRLAFALGGTAGTLAARLVLFSTRGNSLAGQIATLNALRNNILSQLHPRYVTVHGVAASWPFPYPF